jgi:hypothetical protein
LITVTRIEPSCSTLSSHAAVPFWSLREQRVGPLVRREHALWSPRFTSVNAPTTADAAGCCRATIDTGGGPDGPVE